MDLAFTARRVLQLVYGGSPATQVFSERVLTFNLAPYLGFILD